MTTRHPRWMLCGGIGSGKSEVRAALHDFGVRTLDADSIGHEILEPNGPAFAPVATRWPETLVDGAIDRRALGGLVFGDAQELAELESMTHPHIFGTIQSLVEDIDGAVVVEIPLLVDAFGDSWQRAVVDATDQLRSRRAVARGLHEDEVEARMGSQPSRGEWLAAADLVIPNNGDIAELRRTVAAALPVIVGSTTI